MARIKADSILGTDSNQAAFAKWRKHNSKLTRNRAGFIVSAYRLRKIGARSRYDLDGKVRYAGVRREYSNDGPSPNTVYRIHVYPKGTRT